MHSAMFSGEVGDVYFIVQNFMFLSWFLWITISLVLIIVHDKTTDRRYPSLHVFGRQG